MSGATKLSNWLDDGTSLSPKNTPRALINTTFDANGTGNALTNVDVADLAAGVDGELITWDASANPATVSTGDSGEVLTSNGAGTAPTFQAAAGGAAVPFFKFSTDFTPNANDTYTERYIVTTANGGSVLATASKGGLDLRTGGSTSGFASLFANAPQIKINNTIEMALTMGTFLSVNGHQYFAGFKANATEFTATDDIKTVNQKQVGFLFKQESGTTNLYAISADSSIETTLVATPGANEDMALSLVYTTTSIEFFVDGTSQATHTTEVPTNATKGNHLMYWALGSPGISGSVTARSGSYNFSQLV